MVELLVIGYGNPGRGDDGLGPFLVEQLERLQARHGWRGIELLADIQLQVEHALDLQKARLALFIDASVSCPAPYRFERLRSARDDSYTSHAMTPAAVLHVYGTLFGAPPPAFLLSVRGERFGLGTPLSAAASSHAHKALALLERLCRQAQAGAVQEQCERLMRQPDHA